MADRGSPIPNRLVQGVAEAAALGNLRYAEALARQVGALNVDEGKELLEALQLIRQGLRAVARRPNDAQAHLLLARGYFFTDLGDAGLSEATEALRLNPSLGEAAVFIGLEHCYRGELDPARAAYAQARALLPPSNRWLIGLGAALRSVEAASAAPGSSAPAADPWSQFRRKVSGSARVLGGLLGRTTEP